MRSRCAIVGQGQRCGRPTDAAFVRRSDAVPLAVGDEQRDPVLAVVVDVVHGPQTPGSPASHVALPALAESNKRLGDLIGNGNGNGNELGIGALVAGTVTNAHRHLEGRLPRRKAFSRRPRYHGSS